MESGLSYVHHITWLKSGRSTSVKSRLKHNGGKYDAKNAPNPWQF